MKTHRIAIIGTGQSVNNHLEAVRYVGNRAQIIAAVDPDVDRVKAICEQNNIPHWYRSATEMFAAEQPDLVHIVTPPITHLPLILESLAAGAWVYCEKPLCASLADFDRITEAESHSGRYVSTVFQWRFGSAVDHLRRLMATGALGRPLVGLCHTLWYRNLAYYQASWRGKWATEVGGPTATLGIHLMDLFLWLMGDWQEVQAMIGTLDRPIEVEDVSMALVRFQNGAMGSLINSALSPQQTSHLRLDFQRASVDLNALYRYANANWYYSLPDNVPLSESDLTDLQGWQTIDSDLPGTHGVQLAQLLDSIEHNERPLVSGLEARRILEFIASLYKSALTKQPVLKGSITRDDPFYHAMNGIIPPIETH